MKVSLEEISYQHRRAADVVDGFLLVRLKRPRARATRAGLLVTDLSISP